MQQTNKLLIVGASGFIGQRLFQKATSQGLDIVGTYFMHRLPCLLPLDITNEQDLLGILNTTRPGAIVWAAGEKNVKALEGDLEAGLKINTNSVICLVESLKKLQLNSRILYLSSDYVFDGKNGPYKESDPTCPHTVYGASKRRTEEFLTKNWENHIILRTSAVMGKGGTFFDFLVNSVREEKTIGFFDNLNFSPTAVNFLVEAIIELLDVESPQKLYHIAGDKIFSRYEFAQLALSSLAGKAKVIPIVADGSESFRPNMTLKPSEEFRIDFNWKTFISEEVSR